MIENVTPEMRAKWKRKVNAVIEAQESGFIRLTEWEEGFIDNIEVLLSHDTDLSFNQSSCLGRIYARIG